MKSKMLKNKKGITLVSLVITIVIMLILAGVSISFVIGQNGLFKKSSESAETYKNASQNEIDKLNNASDEINNIEEEMSGRTYLYNNGNQCESLTGGWKLMQYFAGYTPGTMTVNSDNITFTSNGADLIMTNNVIDISKYKYIHYEYVFNNPGDKANNSVGILTYDGSFHYLKYKQEERTSNTYSFDLDLEGLTTPSNIYMATTTDGTMTLKSVYMHN